MPDQFPSHIVCAVDFSELSAAALGYAAILSSACGAQATVLHTYKFDVPPYFTPDHAEAIKMQYLDAAGGARTALERFSAGAGLANADFVVEEADPAPAILDAANRLRADLIVIGTHGRSGLHRVMLGSVAERVLRHATIPVLTVRGTKAPGRLNKIVCPVNDSTVSRNAFRIAARLANCFGAQLMVVHVEEHGPKRPIHDLCSWIDGAQRPECSIQEFRRQGNAAEEILKLATATAADLLVMGAEHKMFFDSTVLGTTTVRVVRHAVCPVLTVAETTGGQDVVSASFHQTAR